MGETSAPHDPHFHDFHRHLHGAGRSIARPAPVLGCRSFSGSESAIVALTALTFLILYNAVSMRLRDRTDVGSQIADLSRGTADLARQVAEFGRRLAAVEGRLASANSTGADRIQAVVGEIGELGVLVKQLAVSVASHDDMLSAGVPFSAPSGRPANEPPLFPAEDANGAAAALAPAVVAVPVVVATEKPSALLPQRGANPCPVKAARRGKPARHLPAADGDPAAAQGAFLRSGDAAARRERSGSGQPTISSESRKPPA